MQFSIGVEYALHCMVYLIPLPSGTSLGVREMAEFQGVSETYLSKIFTKLKKAGLVRSMPGVKGGYELARHPEDITLWDIVEAIEGVKPMFQCTQIRKRTAVVKTIDVPDAVWKAPCTVHAVMLEAEMKMRDFLRGRTLSWLSQRLLDNVPQETVEASIQWFQAALEKR